MGIDKANCKFNFYTGAHFLQTAVKKFDELHNSKSKSENKMLDNLILTIAQLYNFKVSINIFKKKRINYT